MRRGVILVLLLGLMELLRPLGSAGYGAQALFTFGFLILAAYTVGEIAKEWHAPKIVGYLLAGAIFGPSALDVLSAPALSRLAPVSELAVGLIAFLAGAELRWKDVRRDGVVYLKVMSVELLCAFVLIAGTILGLHEIIPFLGDVGPERVVAFAMLFAVVAIVHSPAVTMALLSETRARGPVARTTLGVVLVTDVAVVLLFTGVLALARQLVPPPAGAAEATSIAMVAWEIGGALLVGAVLGGAVTFYLRFIGQELMLFALLVTLLGVELTSVLHVESLLTLLMAGFVAENFSRPERGHALRHAMERSAAPIFVVFFALSGAKIDIRAVVSLYYLVLPIVAVRILGIWMGVRLGGRWAGLGAVERRYVWMGLVSQAGVAIGLSAVLAAAYPEMGTELRSLLLATIAINETIGPLLFRRALVANREVDGGAMVGDTTEEFAASGIGAAGAVAGSPVSGTGRPRVEA
jgi:Kef-type K+ transport system membrane component KefB